MRARVARRWSVWVGVLLGIDVGGRRSRSPWATRRATCGVAATPTSPSGRGEIDVAVMIDDLRRLVAEAGVSLRDVDAVGFPSRVRSTRRAAWC